VTRIVLPLVVLLAAASVHAGLLLDDIADEQRALEHALKGAVVAALDGDPGALDRALGRLPAADARQLEPALRLLVIARTDDPAARDDTARALLCRWDGPIADRHRAHLDSIDAARVATRLDRDERHDRWAGAVNDAVRPFGLGTNLLAVVNPVLLAGSALSSALNTAAHIRHAKRASMRERAALASYRRAVAVSPTGRLDPRQARSAERLATRVRAENCRALRETIENAADTGRLAHARYLVGSPAAAPCTAEIEPIRRRVDDVSGLEMRRRKAADWPAARAHLPASTLEWSRYETAARATVIPDPAAMKRSAALLVADRSKTSLGPGAELLIATAHALDGDQAGADERLESVASRGGTTAATARTLLASRAHHDAHAVEKAEGAHRRAVARYVLIGPAVGARSLLQGAAQTGAYGLAGLGTLGIANAIGVLTRAFSAWRRDPASNSEVITRGEAYLERHPDGEDADRVRERLVRAYERTARYERALLHYLALPAPDGDRVRDLENALANAMLARARTSTGDPTLLRAIVTHYPASPAAETAREALGSRDPLGGVRVTREQLEAVPTLLGATGLGLPPGLLDGQRDNGELHDDGIRVTPHAIELALEDRDDERALETLPLDAAAAARVRATLAEVVLAARTRDDAKGEAGRWERYVPIYVAGAVGDDGVSVRPAIKMRPFRSPHPDRYR
jgi:hypothetical protein